MKIPDGTYTGEDFMDDDGSTDEPIRLKLQIQKRGEEIAFDFTGTDAQRPGPCNVTYYQTLSLVMYTMRCVTDPDIPQNEGCYRPLRLIAPKGSALNASFPAACAAGWEICRRGIDVVCRALKGRDAGERAGREQWGHEPVLLRGPHPGTGGTMRTTKTMGGGFGARFDKDGMDGVHSVSNTKNTPVEEMELIYPVFFRRYALNPEQ